MSIHTQNLAQSLGINPANNFYVSEVLPSESYVMEEVDQDILFTDLMDVYATNPPAESDVSGLLDTGCASTVTNREWMKEMLRKL